MKQDPTTTDDLLTSSTADDLSRAFTNFSNATDTPNDQCSTVIIGAGIIGCATAYYLSRSEQTRPDTIHLVEASTELFSSASGKSGGFVAEDWFGPATASLGALSFRLHKELAEQHGGYEAWGYSPSTGTSLIDGGGETEDSTEDWLSSGGTRAQSASLHGNKSTTIPNWLRLRKGDTTSSLTEPAGGGSGVAQVDPLRLCKHLLKQSLQNGVRLHHPATPIRLARDTHNNTLSGLRLRHDNGTDFKIPCTRLLITAGAWTPRVFATLFPHSSLSIPVSPLAGHSLVLRSPDETSPEQCHAVFTTMRDGVAFSPEIFSRVGREIYIAGLNSSTIPLPARPEDAKIDPEAVEQLKRVSRKLLLGRDGKDLEVVREGLCFRPVTRKGVPILAKIDDGDLNAAGAGDHGIKTLESPDGGVFICAGHGPWGISQSLGTGKVLSEMLEGREKLSADIRELGMQ